MDALGLELPPEGAREGEHTSGVIAYLITNLSDAGINIEETVSCHTDTIFIVSESDMINAYSVLNKCIQSAEQIVKD